METRIIIEKNKNLLKDYEQVEEKLKEMVEQGKVKKEKDLGQTTYALPIHHYTLGNGEKEIVVTGAMHGCEIVSTDFVLQLMEKLSDKTQPTEIDLNKYKIHFIPMLNPEGYLISTSAIRQLIPRDMSLEEAEAICREYYQRYRQDDEEAIKKRSEGIEPDRDATHLKQFQEMFKDIDWTCIPEKYEQIRESIRRIYEKYPDIPKGTMQVWSANANGIDPQANFKFHKIVERIMNGENMKGEAYWSGLRYDNMNSIHPGPMNCGIDADSGFKIEPEIKAISDLLQKLSEKGRLYSYLNYHSAGGLLYQRPANPREDMGIEINEMWTRILDNFAFSKLYARKTYKNPNDQEHSRYRILTGKGTGKIDTANDELRVKHPRVILVELSGMGGNPIGPYGDIKGNYTNLMQSNLEAVLFALNYADISEKISHASYAMYKEKIKDGIPEDIVQQLYGIISTASNMMMSWIARFGRKTRREVLEEDLFQMER